MSTMVRRIGRARWWRWSAAAAALGLLLLTYFALSKTGLFAPKDNTWQTMQESQRWRVGMDPSFPPFEQLDASGALEGFDVELARAIAHEWGMKVEIAAIGFDGLLDAMMAGKVDSVISALPFDSRLTKDVRYSAPYFEAGIHLVVLDDSTILHQDALAQRSVAVEWGSGGDAMARRLQGDGVALVRRPYPSPEEALEALVTGAADALLLDGVALFLAQGAGVPIRAIGPALESEPYVIAMPLEASILQAQLDQALQSLRQDGTFDALMNRWFGG